MSVNSSSSSDNLDNVFSEPLFNRNEVVNSTKLNQLGAQVGAQFDIVSEAVGNTYSQGIPNVGGSLGDQALLTPTPLNSDDPLGTVPLMYSAANTLFNKIEGCTTSWTQATIDGILTDICTVTLPTGSQISADLAVADDEHEVVKNVVLSIGNTFYPGIYLTPTGHSTHVDMDSLIYVGRDIPNSETNCTLYVSNLSTTAALEEVIRNVGDLTVSRLTGYVLTDTAISTESAYPTITKSINSIDDKPVTVRWHARLAFDPATHLPTTGALSGPNWVWTTTASASSWADGNPSPTMVRALIANDITNTWLNVNSSFSPLAYANGAPLLNSTGTPIAVTVGYQHSTGTLTITMPTYTTVFANLFSTYSDQSPAYIDVYFAVEVPYRLLQSYSTTYDHEGADDRYLFKHILGDQYGWSEASGYPNTIANRLDADEADIATLMGQASNSLRTHETVTVDIADILASRTTIESALVNNVMTPSIFSDIVSNADPAITHHTVALQPGIHNLNSSPLIVPAFNSIIGVSADECKINGNIVLGRGATLENVNVLGTVTCGEAPEDVQSDTLADNLYNWAEMFSIHCPAGTTTGSSIINQAWPYGYGTNSTATTRWTCAPITTGTGSISVGAEKDSSGVNRLVASSIAPGGSSASFTLNTNSFNSVAINNTIYARIKVPTISASTAEAGVGMLTGTRGVRVHVLNSGGTRYWNVQATGDGSTWGGYGSPIAIGTPNPYTEWTDLKIVWYTIKVDVYAKTIAGAYTLIASVNLPGSLSPIMGTAYGQIYSKTPASGTSTIECCRFFIKQTASSAVDPLAGSNPTTTTTLIRHGINKCHIYNPASSGIIHNNMLAGVEITNSRVTAKAPVSYTGNKLAISSSSRRSNNTSGYMRLLDSDGQIAEILGVEQYI